MSDPEYGIEDIQPEVREPEADEKQHARKQIAKPGATGDFEARAVGAMGHLAAPLHLPTKLQREPALAHYQTAYNTYTSPLRSTLRAMGRVRDVAMTGAPLTPAQMPAKLAKRFKKLSLFAEGDAGAEQAMGAWSSAQTTMQVHANGLYGGQVLLRSASQNFARVQAMLEQRRLEARRAGMIGQIGKIEHTAEVAARIVEVSAEAVMGAAEIDEALDGGIELDESAADDETGAEDAATSETTGQDASQSGQQKFGAGISKAGAGISRGTAVAKQLQKYALAGQSIELKDVFIVVQGDAGRYLQLQKDIEQLSEAIGELEFVEEKLQIASAKSGLEGFTLELANKKLDLRSDRRKARNAAQQFGQSAHAGKEGVLAMYAAEAFQELDLFGTLANAQREQEVDPVKGKAARFVESKWEWFEGQNMIDEAIELRDNLVGVSDQKHYFDDKLPEWQSTAQAWRTFLEVRTQKPLLDGQSETEE